MSAAESPHLGPPRRLTLRQRLALAAGLAVALTVAVASVGAFLAVDARVRADIDRSLEERAQALTAGPVQIGDGPAPPSTGAPAWQPARPRQELDVVVQRLRSTPGTAVYVQLVNTAGATLQAPGSPELPVTERVTAVATGERGGFFSDIAIAGEPARSITVAVTDGIALQIARPTAEADGLLGGLRDTLIVVTIVGALLAVALGWWISGRALRPVTDFTRRTEDIAADRGALRRRLPDGGDDELGRLARSFNTTLGALEESVETQRRLVADASHELRTPIASLRTNIEVLQRGGALAAAERAEILSDLVEQTDELTNIVGDVVEAARGEAPVERQEVRFDEIVTAAAARARRIAPRVRFTTAVEPWVVEGSPERLARLVGNLLDNAAKWTPPGASVAIGLREGVLSVQDQGPGIAAADLPHVFDRFYRADAARGLVGSGLGLAIVRQAVEAHGGTIVAANGPAGGALFTVRLPGMPPAPQAAPTISDT